MLTDETDRLLAYFVVFNHNGFSPSDLRKAQKAQGQRFEEVSLGLALISLAGYFTKTSPDFVNHKGQSISAADQVKALGEAQGIG